MGGAGFTCAKLSVPEDRKPRQDGGWELPYADWSDAKLQGASFSFAFINYRNRGEALHGLSPSGQRP